MKGYNITISANEAYQVMKGHISDEEEIVSMCECTNDYVFGTKRKGGQSRGGLGGYDKVDKETGDVGVMWLSEWFDEVEAGTVKK